MSIAKGDIESGVPNEKTPLVAEAEEDDEKLGEVPENTVKEMVITGLAIVTGGMSIVSMLLYHGVLVLLSGFLGVAVPAYSSIQEQKITEVEALREANKALNRELDILKKENKRLSSTTVEIEQSVNNLNDMEKTMEHLRETQTQNLDDLEEQLRDSISILNSIEKSAKNTIVQNIISTVLAVDTDGDHSLGDEEIVQLMQKIERTQGVDVNEELFQKALGHGNRDIHTVMNLIRLALEEDENLPPDQKVFHFNSD